MYRFHPLSRHGGLAWLALVAFALLLVPNASHSQQANKQKQMDDLEKQIADLQKKLNELKNDLPASTGPKAIWLNDIESWWGLRGTAMSPDGQWFVHSVGPANGSAEMIVRETRGDKEYRYPSGKGGAGAMQFSPDSKWFVFNSAGGGKVKAKEGEKVETPQPAGKKTVLLNLASGKRLEFDNVRSVVFNGEAMTHVALFKNPVGGGAAPAAPPAGAGGKGKGKGDAGDTPPPVAASSGADLVLYEIATGNEITLGNVSAFFFDKKGKNLIMSTESRDLLSNAIQMWNVANNSLTSLDTGKAIYQGMSWSDKEDRLIALKSTENPAYEGRLCSIITLNKVTSGTTPEKMIYDPHADMTFPSGMAITSNRAPTFTDDGSAIVFAIRELKKKDTKAPPKTEPEPAKGDKGAAKKGGKGGAGAPVIGAGLDKPDLVIWHWLDERIQSQQQVQANQDKNVTYLCAYRPAEKKFIRLADDKLRNVSLAPKGKYAIAQDGKPYQYMSTLDGKKYQDIYTIDMRTGARQKSLTKARNYNGASPDGMQLLFYDDGHFFIQEIASGKSRKITENTPASFINDEDDHNVAKPPTRTMGWSKDGNYVLISDNWDVWKVPVDGSAGVNLTVNGKKDAIRYRNRVSMNPEEKGIDLNQPQYFSMMEEWTKRSGIGRVDPGQPGVTNLLMDDCEFGGFQKAKDSDVVLYTRETYNNYPDYYVTDLTFKDGKKLTNGLPNLDKYLWSSGVKLITYTSAKGDKLQAALFLPANYEKGKSYPTVVYIYEKLTNGLNKYQAPGANGFNKALYTSNGYAVLMPDIKYTINDPGMSAVWCVVPALKAAVETGIVDKNKVGIHGHSWGGYQTAFLVTQTDAFKAAVAGAPLTNMVSMYSSIYWNTGTSNQAIFESSQGRFSGGYWDNMEAYVRNSPVFHATKVNTPLIILHNDKDGAVDFNQGIEYYNTLRRLEKPVVMLQYKGENHGLAKAANKKDYTVRMREFFDHHLMGKPAPAWMTEGVPHLKIDEHLTDRAKEVKSAGK